MRLFLDTEFNGFGGDLISLALTPENENYPEFYGVYPLPDKIDPWVWEHVIPPLLERPRTCSLLTVREAFHGYIKLFDNPEIICDWHRDAEIFCSLLAGEDYGSSLDLDVTIYIVKTPPGQPVSALPHNALEDARALKTWYLHG